MRSHLSRAEQETLIRRAADEDSWEVFSENPTVIRKLTELYGQGERVGPHGFQWRIGRNCLTFRRPRNLTEAQRREIGKRLLTARTVRRTLEA